MRNEGVITAVSVSHTLASVEELESAIPAEPPVATRRLLGRDGVDEAFVLATCNRAEAYVVTDDAADGRAALADFAPEVREGAVVHLDHEDAIRHLMRVAAGLESLVLGEDQVIGQVKDAADGARELDALGPVLEEVLLKAVHVGERARTETGINEGVVSLGSAAVELAAREANLEGATALVVGAGEMGALTARALDETGIDRLVVANRSVPTAEHLARDVGVDAAAIGLDDVAGVVPEADLVVTATGASEHVLSADDLAAGGETVCIDIAQPRDVDPAAGDRAGVTLLDLDDLEAVTDEARARREAEAREVEAMIDAEFDRLLESFKRSRADEAISAMYEGAERVKHREVEEALARLDAQGDLTDEQRETVESLADTLVSHLLAPPTMSLRQAAAEDDWTTIQTAMRLFDPSSDAGTDAGPATDVEAGTETTDAPAGDDDPVEAAEGSTND